MKHAALFLLCLFLYPIAAYQERKERRRRVAKEDAEMQERVKEYMRRSASGYARLLRELTDREWGVKVPTPVIEESEMGVFIIAQNDEQAATALYNHYCPPVRVA